MAREEEGVGTGAAAADELFPAVYAELRRIAHRELNARPSETLCATELVHEVWLKLAGGERGEWQGRAHLLGTAAVAMRFVLVDRARRRCAEKRGGVRRPVTLDEGAIASDDDAESLLELDEALTRLGEVEPRLARVVELRFFGGLTAPEAAETLGVTERTVRREWVKARAWLFRALRR